MNAPASTTARDPSRPRENHELRTVILALIAFSACSTAAAIRSKGFQEADGANHYLFARYAFQEPFRLVDIWGRPLFTILFSLPAQFGVIGVRLMSLGMAIGCGLVAMRIAAGQKYRWPVLALIFTLGQPLLFLHSFSELTELPFALIIGMALWAYQCRRWGAMALFCAIGPLARPEGFFFLILAAIALVIHGQWKWLIVLPMGLLAWSLAGHWIIPDAPWWDWLKVHWPYETESVYQSGSLFYFVGVLPVLVGPFMFPAMWIGMGLNLSSLRHRSIDRHRAWVDGLIAILPLMMLAGHSLLYWLGKMSSNGEPRYLLIVAPMWGLLSARGWGWVFDRLNWPRAVSWGALAAVLAGLVNFAWRIVPTENSWLETQRLVAWYQNSPLHTLYPRIMTNHPAVFVYMNVSGTDQRFAEPWTGQAIDHPPPGVILFWDPIYAMYNSNAQLVMPLPRVVDGGWVHDWLAEQTSDVNKPPPWANPKAFKSSPLPKNSSLANTPMLWHIFLSPTDAQNRLTPSKPRGPSDLDAAEAPGNPWIASSK